MRVAFNLLIILAAMCSFRLFRPAQTARADTPYGIDVRVPWTSSHVHGSPEPPMPFRVQRAYPKLTFKTPVDVAFDAGSKLKTLAGQYLFGDWQTRASGWRVATVISFSRTNRSRRLIYAQLLELHDQWSVERLAYSNTEQYAV